MLVVGESGESEEKRRCLGRTQMGLRGPRMGLQIPRLVPGERGTQRGLAQPRPASEGPTIRNYAPYAPNSGVNFNIITSANGGNFYQVTVIFLNRYSIFGVYDGVKQKLSYICIIRGNLMTN